jgi:hypothetical protein
MREEAMPLRQRIGRRLGVVPYYRIAEQAPDQLGLVAQSELNRPAGRRILLIGVLLLILATVLLISGAVAAGQGAGFGPVAITVALGGLFGGFGMQRIVGGRAVLSVRNRIEVTPEHVLFVQQSAGYPEQTQELPITAITGARLRRRPLAVGALMRRVQPIVALELLAGDEVWIVDSAADAEALRPTAEALCRVLGIGLEQQARTVGASSD